MEWEHTLTGKENFSVQWLVKKKKIKFWDMKRLIAIDFPQKMQLSIAFPIIDSLG